MLLAMVNVMLKSKTLTTHHSHKYSSSSFEFYYIGLHAPKDPHPVQDYVMIFLDVSVTEYVRVCSFG